MSVDYATCASDTDSVRDFETTTQDQDLSSFAGRYLIGFEEKSTEKTFATADE